LLSRLLYFALLVLLLQLAHWKVHKAQCKKVQQEKEAAAAAAAAAGRNARR
jgi:hypothetical protein